MYPSDHLLRDWTVYQVPPSNGEKKQQIVKIISIKIISLFIENYFNENHFRAPSLRGHHHSKIPDINNQPLNTLLPETRDNIQHVRPYYLTQFIKISLAEIYLPPWSAVTKQVKMS